MKFSKIGIIILLLIIAAIVLFVLYERKMSIFKESMSNIIEPKIIKTYDAGRAVIPFSNAIVYDPVSKKIVNIEKKKEGFREGIEGDDTSAPVTTPTADVTTAPTTTPTADVTTAPTTAPSADVATATPTSDSESSTLFDLNSPPNTNNSSIYNLEFTTSTENAFMFIWNKMLLIHNTNNTNHISTGFIPDMTIDTPTAYNVSYAADEKLPTTNANYTSHPSDEHVVQQLFYKGRKVYQINKFVKFDALSGSLILDDEKVIRVFSRPESNNSAKPVGQVYDCQTQAEPKNTGISNITGGFFAYIFKTGNMDILFSGYEKKTLIAVFVKVGGSLQLLSTTRFDELTLVSDKQGQPSLDFSAPTTDLACNGSSAPVTPVPVTPAPVTTTPPATTTPAPTTTTPAPTTTAPAPVVTQTATEVKKDELSDWKKFEEEMKKQLEQDNPLAKFYLWLNMPGRNKVSEDYILKTQVVPPVCPSCPSCAGSVGVCNTCGGNGGSGTYIARGNANVYSVGVGYSNIPPPSPYVQPTSPNLIRLGNGQIINTAVTGAIDLGENVVGGTIDLTKQAVGGTVGLARETVGGAVDLTKQAVGGTVGLAREAAGGVVGLAREAVGGVARTVGDVASVFDPRNYYTLAPGQTTNVRYGGPNRYEGSVDTGIGGVYSRALPEADPMSYYGALRTAQTGDYVPMTADFSAFGR